MFKPIEAAIAIVIKTFRVAVGLVAALLVLAFGLVLYFGLRAPSHTPAPSAYSPPPQPIQTVVQPVSVANSPRIEQHARRIEPTPPKEEKPVHVKGHYRNGKWIEPFTRNRPTKKN